MSSIRDSSVGINYGLVVLGLESRQGDKIFSSPKCADRIWSPPSLVYVTALLWGLKRPWREAHHWPNPVLGLRISGAIPALILCAFMEYTVNRHLKYVTNFVTFPAKHEVLFSSTCTRRRLTCQYTVIT